MSPAGRCESRRFNIFRNGGHRWLPWQQRGAELHLSDAGGETDLWPDVTEPRVHVILRGGPSGVSSHEPHVSTCECPRVSQVFQLSQNVY